MENNFNNQEQEKNITSIQQQDNKEPSKKEGSLNSSEQQFKDILKSNPQLSRISLSQQQIPVDFLLNKEIIQHLPSILGNMDKSDQRQYDLALKEADVNKDLNLKHFDISLKNSQENRQLIVIIFGSFLAFILGLFVIVGVSNFSIVKEILGMFNPLLIAIISASGGIFYGKWKEATKKKD